MKVKIKECFGKLPEWFTVDKIYDAQSRSYDTFLFEDDKGDLWIGDFESCSLLNGGS